MAHCTDRKEDILTCMSNYSCHNCPNFNFWVMKELTIEEKAKRYDEAIERAKSVIEQNPLMEYLKKGIEYIFSEKESKDERIRKRIIQALHGDVLDMGETTKAIAWLEKQGGQKPADKLEPKFKVKYASNEYNVLDIKDIAGVTFYGIEDEPNHIDYVQAENCERVGGYGIKENGSPYPTKPAVFSDVPEGEDFRRIAKLWEI